MCHLWFLNLNYIILLKLSCYIQHHVMTKHTIIRPNCIIADGAWCMTPYSWVPLWFGPKWNNISYSTALNEVQHKSDFKLTKDTPCHAMPWGNYEHGIYTTLSRLPVNTSITTVGIFEIGYHEMTHYSDITWVSWCLKSPTIQLFIQELIQTNTKALYHWAQVRGIHQSLLVSPRKRPVIWKLFSCHAIIMTT